MPRPYLALVALWALYFHPLLLHPAWVLYADYSDFLAEHLPAKIFLAKEWRETGELPLWNPFHHAGSPFVHDIQVGVFYPPYAVAYLVPERFIGAALSWVVALHVLLAGVLGYVYARSRGLGEIGAVVAAAGFMLSAKWMTHLLLAGHTVTIGLAWLPLLLLWLERAIRTGGSLPVVGAGVAFALILLGTHTQWAFYAGVFAAAWTAGGSVRRWLLCGLGAVLVAVLLCAVQLLPTLEAARYSARTVGLTSTLSGPVAVLTFFGMIGPSVSYEPPRTWEMRAIFAAYWLAAACAAPFLARAVRWQAGVFAGLIAFSLGGAVLFEWLPGFNVFRVPSRMLLVATFPLAFLAGVTTDALARANWSTEARRTLRKSLLWVAGLGVLPTAFWLAVSFQQKPALGVWGNLIAYWVAVGVGLPAVVWLVLPKAGGRPQARTAAWVAVLLVELFVPVAMLPQVKPQERIYPPSETLKVLTANRKPGQSRVLDRDVGGGEADKLAVLGVGSPQALVYRVESLRGYNPLDVLHFREFLSYVVGDPTPVLALSPIAQPIVPNFDIANRTLFDLTNTQFIVCASDDPLAKAGLPAIMADDAPPLVPAIPRDAPEKLPRHFVFTNPSVLPRAFLVPAAAAMPKGGELDALKASDFRKTVLLTGVDPLPPTATGPVGTAKITDYRANRVAVKLDGATGGMLFLGDVWFPGWVCRIDGTEVPIYRANHAFRAVAVPPGAAEAVFTFEPRSYRAGWWVSTAALAFTIAFGVVRGVRRRPA